MKLILLIVVGSAAGLKITVFDESVSITYPEAFSANIRFRKDHKGGTTVLEGLWSILDKDLKRCQDFQSESLIQHFFYTLE